MKNWLKFAVLYDKERRGKEQQRVSETPPVAPSLALPTGMRLAGVCACGTAIGAWRGVSGRSSIRCFSCRESHRKALRREDSRLRREAARASSYGGRKDDEAGGEGLQVAS